MKGGHIHVHLVAPPLLSWGLQRLVRAAGSPFVLVASSATLAHAMPLLERAPPDVILLDLDDGYTPQDVADLYDQHRAKVLVLTCSADASLFDRLVTAGARGVLRKHEDPSQMLTAMQVVGMGGSFLSKLPLQGRPTTLAAPGSTLEGGNEVDSKLATLTSKERQAIEAVTADPAAPVKVIADRLRMSEHTLRNHLTSIYAKLGVTGRLALQAFAGEQRPKGAAGRM